MNTNTSCVSPGVLLEQNKLPTASVMRDSSPDNATMAVYLDLENLVLGVQKANYPEFDVRKILERLLLKGHIVVKKAYCDFARYRDFRRGLHETAFELIEIPHVRQSGKNSADIRMVVDALDLCYTKGHVDTFVIVSGDSDFSPLVSKLRENAKTVVGVGVKNSTSDLFIDNCDDFIYYDDLVRAEPDSPRNAVQNGAPVATPKEPAAATPAPVSADDSGTAKPVVLPLRMALGELMRTVQALNQARSADDMIWASMVKQAIKRRNPGFNERAFGLRSFRDLLMAAKERGLLELSDSQKGDVSVRLPG